MSQIDTEMVIPQVEVPNTEDGLIWACKQRYVTCTHLHAFQVTPVRDMLEWPGMIKNMGDSLRGIEKWDVASRVDSMLRQFCPLLGCIQPACPSHSTWSIAHPILLQPSPSAHDHKLNQNVTPTLNNDSLRQRTKKNCRNMCFRLESDEYIVRVTGD